jgi:pimeloyl-ACP methyl ester carboxylesterase
LTFSKGPAERKAVAVGSHLMRPQNKSAMKFLFIFFITLVSAASGFSQSPKRVEVIFLNGTNIYYEVYGKGEPLIFLHGYAHSTKYWLPYISDYINDFEIYLIDLNGHGKSNSWKEKLSVASAANDVDALMKHLKLKNINAIGFSYGGNVLFQLALLDSELVKSMISIGACGNWNAKEHPVFLEYLSYKNIDNLKWIREHQSNEAQIKALLDQLPDRTAASISDKELKRIQTKTLIVLGDRDNVTPLESAAFARKYLSESYLWILPNTGHGAHEGKNKIDFVRVSKNFFSQSWPK